MHPQSTSQVGRSGLVRTEVDAELTPGSLWWILAEPIQTIMRRYNVKEPYEKLKALTRGQGIDQAILAAFIDTLDIPEEGKAMMRQLTPCAYTGNAGEQASKV